ncbi:phage baseplate assembly protein [Yersinia enterocolitica]|uniref:phage baseplate assembly protein n=1 Tax=Yersinia enterocolitica TaxID=630 RepID=UPI002877142F|nr:baseplate protein [Yersinia enterocolitica]EKN5062835.1 baseplate protein [Yersinia enterocolitica]EKN6005334.1 baseplate protein [Yersinia enterocolitica]EKN6150208.1 baseplate protein [Yersinia enterocolitica]ELI8277794.1 baseplate protein [Yersinia enterocolitica]
MNNDVTLRVNGREWVGWTSVSISAGIERLARDFNVEITRQWPGSEEAGRLQPRVKKGDAVTVLIGTDLVVTGYIDATPVRYDARSVSVGIVGRSKTEDLIDCAALITQFTGRSFVQIATQLAAPFSVSVVNAGVENTPMQGLQVDYGETVVDVLDKMMGIQQVLAYDNPAGALVIGPVGASHTVTALVLGENIISCDTEQSIKDRFSEYVVAGQRSGNDDDFGTATTNAIRAKTVDGGVSRYRPMVIKQSGNATGGSVIERSQFEMLRRAARTDEVTYTVQGWRQGNGDLWSPNQLVTVFDPVLGFNNREMLIAEVTYSKNEQGTITQLRIGPADAYLPKPPNPNKQRRKKAEEDEF